MGFWSKVKAGAKWLKEKAVGAAKIIYKTVVNGAKAVAHFVGEKVKAGVNAVVEGAKKVMTRLESFVTKAKDFLHTAWTKVKEKIRSFATKAFIGAAHVLKKSGKNCRKKAGISITTKNWGRIMSPRCAGKFPMKIYRRKSRQSLRSKKNTMTVK